MDKASSDRRQASLTQKAKNDYRFLVRPLRDRERIRLLLEPEPAYSAYALGQLEPELFSQSEWWLAQADGREALLMHSRGGLGNALVTFGDSLALQALFSLHPGPVQTFATFRVDHREALRQFFALAHDKPMLRMMVTADSFAVPAEEGEETADGSEVRRLSDSDIPAVDRLYSSEGNRFYYRARRIEEGVYFGVFSDQQLVAVAGTHAVCRENGIAVVGNVFTHPSHRNNHFALRATGAVTETLLQTCQQAVLTVAPENTAAIRAYSRLGYREECELIECGVTRKETFGLGTLARRLLARWRGRGKGGEMVTLAEDEEED